MAMSEESGRLLEMARRDFRALAAMVEDHEAFADEVFGFHAQQAVEKAVKARLDELGTAYPKTHDLDELFSLVADAGAEVPPNLTNSVTLWTSPCSTGPKRLTSPCALTVSRTSVEWRRSWSWWPNVSLSWTDGWVRGADHPARICP
jgi:hypothetical protein